MPPVETPATPAAGTPPPATPPAAPPVAPPPPPNPAKQGAQATPPAKQEGQEGAKPAADAPPPAKPATPPRKEAHEAFLSAEFPAEDPLWKGGHKNLPTFEEILEVTSEPGRKFLANVRADYSRKTAELANARKADQDALAAERQVIATERERLAQLATPEFRAHLEAMKKGAEGADPFTAEGQEKIAEAKAAALYERMIRPIQEQVEKEANMARYRAYVAKNPDFEEPATRKGVMAILQAKPHLTLEEAHDLWRGARAREESTRLRERQSAADADAAKTLKMTGAGGLANTEEAAVPVFKSATEAERYHRSRGMR